MWIDYRKTGNGTGVDSCLVPAAVPIVREPYIPANVRKQQEGMSRSRRNRVRCWLCSLKPARPIRGEVKRTIRHVKELANATSTELARATIRPAAYDLRAITVRVYDVAVMVPVMMFMGNETTNMRFVMTVTCGLSRDGERKKRGRDQGERDCPGHAASLAFDFESAGEIERALQINPPTGFAPVHRGIEPLPAML